MSIAETDEDLIVLGDDVPEPAAPQPDHKLPTKRPNAYDPKLAENILLAVADGATLREIAALPDMPTKSTIQRWIMKYPDLKRAWQAARELSAATLEDDALDMARTLRDQTAGFTGTAVRAFEVAMNQFRWSAAHRDPATFGSSQQPSAIVPIQIITSLDIGQGGVKTDVQTNTYEVAAKINSAYNDNPDAQIEGTDYTLEPGQAPEAPQPGAGNPFDAAAAIRPKGDALRVKKRGTGGRPHKGWKSPAQIKGAITKAKNKKKP